MSEAPEQVYTIERKNTAMGQLQESTLRSDYLNEDRRITIHIPANYGAKVEHKLLMVFDKENYGGRISRRLPIPTLVLMDNLLSEKAIKPTITVVV